jgi:hypothetical protein
MRYLKVLFCLGMMLLPVIFPLSAQAYRTEHVVVVLIDGVRYTESLGDTTRTYTPRMWALSTQGTVLDSAFNDSVTVTAYAIPATWMGRFWPLQDTTYQGNSIQFCRYPTVWEYARHDLGLPIEKAIYVTPDYGSSTWMPSFYSGYGPSYWPHMVQPPTSDNNNQADFDSSIVVLRRNHPMISYIYLPDTDHAGHSGVWADYIAKIWQADSLVNELWNVIQADSIMRNKTTMIVTNDHGRHDDTHGGFRNHGDSCFGCRHVMMFAIGPDIARGVHQNTPRASIRDIAHTAGELLGFTTPLSPGRILSELFAPPDTCDYLPGDVNNTADVNGIDVIYLVNYLKGGPAPPLTCDNGSGPFFVAADLNGDCATNGLDAVWFVNYLKGGPQISHCPDYPPGA